MKGHSNWAVTAGRSGVYFTPGPGNAGAAPPDVEVRAVLPDGSELRPTVQTPDARSDVGGYVFDPPLPEGSVVYLNGSPLLTAGPPGH